MGVKVFVPRVTVSGPERRQRLVEATVRLIVRGGLTAVSHRTVSEEAGLPATATTYYFSSLDTLLSVTFRAYFESFIHDSHGQLFSAVSGRAQRVDAVVDGFYDLVESRSEAYRALFELQLVASRRPELRGYSGIYWERQIQSVQDLLGLPAASARAVIALFDGYLVAFLSTGAVPDRGDFLRLLEALIDTETGEAENVPASPGPGAG